MYLTTEEFSALKLSFGFSVCAATIGTIGSIALGFFLSRSRIKWKWIIESVSNLPFLILFK